MSKHMPMKWSKHVQSKADDSSESFSIYTEYLMREINSELFKNNYLYFNGRLKEQSSASTSSQRVSVTFIS